MLGMEWKKNGRWRKSLWFFTSMGCSVMPELSSEGERERWIIFRVWRNLRRFSVLLIYLELQPPISQCLILDACRFLLTTISFPFHFINDNCSAYHNNWYSPAHQAAIPLPTCSWPFQRRELNYGDYRRCIGMFLVSFHSRFLTKIVGHDDNDIMCTRRSPSAVIPLSTSQHLPWAAPQTTTMVVTTLSAASRHLDHLLSRSTYNCLVGPLIFRLSFYSIETLLKYL